MDIEVSLDLHSVSILASFSLSLSKKPLDHTLILKYMPACDAV